MHNSCIWLHTGVMSATIKQWIQLIVILYQDLWERHHNTSVLILLDLSARFDSWPQHPALLPLEMSGHHWLCSLLLSIIAPHHHTTFSIIYWKSFILHLSPVFITLLWFVFVQLLASLCVSLPLGMRVWVVFYLLKTDHSGEIKRVQLCGSKKQTVLLQSSVLWFFDPVSFTNFVYMYTNMFTCSHVLLYSKRWVTKQQRHLT